jgi:hypothetical protein
MAKFAADESGLQGLTPKMYRFAALRFSGASIIDAYKAVYDVTGLAPANIPAKAAEVAHHPLVTAKIRELRVAADQQSTLLNNVSREFVLNGLTGLALASSKDSVKLGAYQTLGKILHMFTDTPTPAAAARSVDEVDAALVRKLAEMREALTIEGKAEPVTPASRKDRRRKPAK